MPKVYSRSVVATAGMLSVLPLQLTGQDREWVQVSEERVLVRGRIDDSFLLQPGVIAAGSGIIAVIDYGDMSVKAIDRTTGQLAWQRGRSGEGPWELKAPTDIAIGPADSVWVLDVGNQRIYVLASDGSEGRVIRATDGPYRMAVASRGIVIGASSPRDGMLSLYSMEGTRRQPFNGPDWLSALSPMTADYWIGADAETGIIAVVFQYTGRILVGNDTTEFLREVPAIAIADDPEVVRVEVGGQVGEGIAPGHTRIARSVAVGRDRIAVLSGRLLDSKWTTDIVDFYANGDYAYSIQLPRPAERIAVWGRSVVALETTLIPTIVELVVPGMTTRMR